jgi:hypothetical protein
MRVVMRVVAASLLGGKIAQLRGNRNESENSAEEDERPPSIVPVFNQRIQADAVNGRAAMTAGDNALR